VIDLHMHTTASDGRSSAESLIAEVVAAGCVTVAVTDHDTVAALTTARAAADAAGIRMVDGIEMTAVEAGADIHILGYFIDPLDPSLAAFLRGQREHRRARVAGMGDLLKKAGVPVDIEDVLAVPVESGRAVGRPAVAQALVTAGHATDMADAFGRFLAVGRPGYLPRKGASAADVIERIRAAGGVASVAHPGKMHRDHLIEPMVEAGLEAIEVYHPDHTVADAVRYQTMADRFGVLVTGGSDYHGPGSGRVAGLGHVGLPPVAFERLAAHAADRTRRA
jgi:predicted metal-dependent phosphoesterase TrpH